MGFLAIIEFIAKILGELKNIFLFLKKNKFLSKNFFAIIILISLGIFIMLKFIINYNENYLRVVNSNELTKMITGILIKCGDKTSLSVAIVSLKKEGDFYNARFSQAFSCNKLIKETNCIVNLQQYNPRLYLENRKIDATTYNFLLSTSEKPSYISLRNNDNKQDLSEFEYKPAIKNLIETTEWGVEGILNNITITSIKSLDRNLLYVITFIQAKEHRDIKCQEPSDYLFEIKNFILK